ncbi:TetR/AcrR family transcriptional regulator [Arenibaculum pallidiluteum]|uniref:TetR/AcrR family transcriptional regulator n=1 Tax=Arenibaculum pallidiluteum TaxID=2812559 RepID=UPI001B3BF4DE|nr:TetR/AcrR family transcriptional regulator [Arenibaculum pallidiluteum]
MSVPKDEGQGNGAAPRWRRRKDARPDEIVEAALEVFARRGFAAARLEDVAARAGISKGTLYLYFPNKEELFKAAVRTAIVPGIAAGERLAADPATPSLEVLRSIVGGIAARMMTSPAGVIPKLMIAEAGNFPELARFYFDEVIRRGFALLSSVLEHGIARGEFRPVPVAATVRLVIAPVLLMAVWRTSFEAVEGKPQDVDGIVAAHLDAMGRSLAPDGAERRPASGGAARTRAGGDPP